MNSSYRQNTEMQTLKLTVMFRARGTRLKYNMGSAGTNLKRAKSASTLTYLWMVTMMMLLLLLMMMMMVMMTLVGFITSHSTFNFLSIFNYRERKSAQIVCCTTK